IGPFRFPSIRQCLDVLDFCHVRYVFRGWLIRGLVSTSSSHCCGPKTIYLRPLEKLKKCLIWRFWKMESLLSLSSSRNRLKTKSKQSVRLREKKRKRERERTILFPRKRERKRERS